MSNSKPTEHQVFTLVREYEAVLYDLQEDAKAKGAYHIVDAIQEAINEDAVLKAVRLISTKMEASKAIANCYSCKKEIVRPVRIYLEEYLKRSGAEVSLEAQHEA